MQVKKLKTLHVTVNQERTTVRLNKRVGHKQKVFHDVFDE